MCLLGLAALRTLASPADLLQDKLRAELMLEEARAEVVRLSEEFADAAASQDPFAGHRR